MTVDAPVPFAVPPLDGMQDLTRMRFLFDCVERFADASIGVALEIGCYKGGSTVVLAQACQRAGFDRLFAIDLFTGTPSWAQGFDTYDDCRRRLQQYELQEYVHLIRGDSHSYPWREPLSVLHVDGDHAYAAVTMDLAHWMPRLQPGGIAVFDDYDDAHRGVVRAVHDLLARDPGLAVLACNNHRADHGSICVRRSCDAPSASWNRSVDTK